jgi:hypothetical protein
MYMLWNTYEAEKHYEQRSRELERQWKLLQGGAGKKETASKLVRKRIGKRVEPEKREEPQPLACRSCNPV